jgi:very-short-patch-repair endonuclease
MEPIRHSQAPARGFTSEQLRRSPHFVHPVAGVAQIASSADDLAATCRAIAMVLPDDAVFTHLTAAALRGWWLPMLDDLPIIACSDGDAPHHDRRGVYVRRCGIPPGHRHRVRGAAIASPEWTIIELAEHLALLDLVAVIDSALHAGDTSIERIRAVMRPGRRGVRVLRRALDLADGRSESWWETMLRLVHVLSGIPVEPQQVIVNAAGVEIARVDLRILGSCRVPEYDGSEHRERQRHEVDLRRDKALARQGLERYGYIATELIHASDRIIRDAEDALGLVHLPGRGDLWRSEARRATISAAGQAALRRRLTRFVRTSAPRSRRTGDTSRLPGSGAL